MRIKTFVLGLAVGATATIAWADSPSGSSAVGPALPLPEISSTWNTGAQPSGVVSTSYNSPSGSSWDQQPPSPPKAEPSPSDQPPTAEAATSCVSEPSCGCNSSSPAGCGCESMGGGNCCCNPWYGYAGGLVMTRDQPNKYWTTYNQANNADQLLNTANANVHWDGGGEFTIGRSFGCDNKVDLTYWGIWQMKGGASITDPNNNLGTPMDTDAGSPTLNGQPADSFYANSHEVLLQRNDQVNNVELNWSYCPSGADRCRGVTSTWMAGLRYFRFDEDLLWTTVANGDTLGENGGADQANLEFRCKNDMLGFQVGNRLDWRITDHFGLYFGTKAGIYGNQASTEASWYTGSGVNGFTYYGHKDDIAFIGQADLGLNYDFNCRWSATIGYRVVVATGIALADNQIPFYLAGQDDFQDVKTNGDLVLHGALAGISFCW